MKNFYKIFWKSVFIATLLLFTGTVFSQNRIITGVVTDAESGEPLIGANILVKGTSRGTITDLDGHYSLEVGGEDNILVFSYTGYNSQEIVLGASNEINVALGVGMLLEEVVVVGYGTQKAKEVTGAVSYIKAEDFNKGNINDPAQLLQGKVAGVSIAKPGGDPNGSFQIRLRGLSTFGANASPLIIIDGVPGASLETVDPQDIESVNVLKDGSAAAIYGTRAATGVILITTKSGKKDASRVEYNAYVSLESIASKPDVLSTEDYLEVVDNDTTNNFGSSTDWYDELTRSAFSHTHSLAFSGGNDRGDYRLSLNYRDVQGVAITTGFDQLNGRLNLTQRALNDRVKFQVLLSSTVRNEDIGVPDAFNFAANYNPTAPVLEETEDAQEWGGYFQRDAFAFFNPVAVMEQNTREAQKKRIIGSLRTEVVLLKGLTGAVFYSQEKTNDLFNEYFSKASYWTPYATSNHDGWAKKFTEEKTRQIFEGTGNYEKNIERLNLKLLAGYAYEEGTRETTEARAAGFLSDKFSFNNLEAGTKQLSDPKTKSYKEAYKLIGFFGRVSLNYDDTYFLTANVRREGSSKFGKNNRWGTFPGLSAGFNLDNIVNIPMVDQLKLRGGYGITGNTPLDAYLYIARYTPDPNALFFYQGQYIAAYDLALNNNPDLKWETKTDISFGLDFSLFNYILTGSADYFITKTKDLILEFTVPSPPNPADRSYLNLAAFDNSGFELTLGVSELRKGDFSWSSNLAFTQFINTKLRKITSEQVKSEGTILLGELGAPFLTNVYTARIEEGAAIGQLIAPVLIGKDESGQLLYRAANGDTTLVPGLDDYQVVGNGLPDFQLGFNNTFRYKGFDFNFFIRGVFGHDLVNVFNARYGHPNNIGTQSGATLALDYLNTSGYSYADIHVENASFIRLDNASLGYTFQNLHSGSIRSLRFYLTGQNLLTITDYTGSDPEVRFVDDRSGDGINVDPLAPGIDRGNTYVTTRGFTFGVNVGF